MVVEVVAGEVREHRAGEPKPGAAALVEGVARDLDRRGVAAVLDHAGERRMKFKHARRRELGRQDAPAVVDEHRAHQSAPPARGDEQLADQEADRRLAVGPGDADQFEPFARAAMEAVGDRAERLAQAIGFDLAERDEPRQRFEHRRDAGRTDHPDRAALDRVGDVGPSVLARSRTREEEVTRTRTTRVVDEAAHHRVDPRRAGDVRERGDEIGEERRGVRGHGCGVISHRDRVGGANGRASPRNTRSGSREIG